MPRTFTNLRYHIVFGTKMRLPLHQAGVSGGALPVHRWRRCTERWSGDCDQRDRGSRSSAGRIETGSFGSNWINKTGKSRDHFGWQEGYGTFTVSESQVPVVKRYIELQEEHHRQMSFNEELLNLYRMHKIDFEETDLDR